jgi:hypothetical protein
VALASRWFVIAAAAGAATMLARVDAVEIFDAPGGERRQPVQA